VLKYTVEFISEDAEKTITTFLLTAAAIGMLFKRGSTISAAEGGCQAEVGVACSMAAGAFAACMGASPEVVLQAAEIGIEHNLGLTCDPIDGLVQVRALMRLLTCTEFEIGPVYREVRSIGVLQYAA
jgi:L-serine deaminase